MKELIDEAKEFLSIAQSSNLKNNEIESLLEAAKLELSRVGIIINLENGKYNSLVKIAMMFYVKSYFGNVDIKEKEYALKAFNNIEQCLALSVDFKLEKKL